MKIFAASTFADTANLFVKKVKKGRVLFVINAGDPWNHIDYDDKKAFEAHGFELDMIDLRKEKPKLSSYDIIHFCGGSAIYLLKLLKEKNMVNKIVDAVRGGLVYTGTSAGSMILAPDISFCADDEDEKDAGMIGALQDMTGLNLVPFYSMCHAQDDYYIDSTTRAITRLPQNKVPILFLNDNMAVWCVNGKLEFVQN